MTSGLLDLASSHYLSTFPFSGHESNVDNVLPDTLFASPTKKSAESRTPNCSILAEANASTAVTDSSLFSESSLEMPTTSTTDMASHD
ncbi:hypothetical protein ACOSQ2_017359 [Xanthoceras sorbifolium]